MLTDESNQYENVQEISSYDNTLNRTSNGTNCVTNSGSDCDDMLDNRDNNNTIRRKHQHNANKAVDDNHKGLHQDGHNNYVHHEDKDGNTGKDYRNAIGRK